MSHRTAATALLLASSLPYGLGLPQPKPQVIPFLSELDLSPDVKPTPLILPIAVGPDSSAAAAAPTVTVVGTVLQDAVESAVESAVEGFTDAIKDAVGSVTSALETATEVLEDVLPPSTGAPSVIDPEADILPLIFPGILPVETDLPPLVEDEDEGGSFFPDFDAFDLSVLLGGLENSLNTVPLDDDLEFPYYEKDVELENVELPAPSDAVPALNDTLPVEEEDLPDTNELEVIDLPPPNTTVPEEELATPDVLLPEVDLPIPTEIPYGDDVLIPEAIPLFPVFPDEATVPISTFNKVVQPLLSVIQTLLNSLPGNAAVPRPDIFIDPLLPTATPDILIDPLLPSELSDPLLDLLVGPSSSPLVDVVNTSDVPLQKRQALVPVPLTTQGIFDLVASILQSINALVQAIPVVGPTVANIVDDVTGAVLNPPVDAPPVPLPSPIDVEIPDVLDNGPAVPLPLPLDVEFPDVLDSKPPVPLIFPQEGALEPLPPVGIADPNVLDNGPAVPLPFPLDVEFPDAPVADPNVLNNGPAVPLPFPLDVEFPDAPVDPPVLPISNITLPSLVPPSPPLSEVLPTDVAVPEPEIPSILPLPAPVGPISDVPDEVLNIPFPDDIEGIDWAAFESPPFSDLPESTTTAEELPIPDDVLNIPVPDFDEDGNLIDPPVEVLPIVSVPAEAVSSASAVVPAVTVISAVAGAPASLPTSLDAFGDFDSDDEGGLLLPDWPFTEIPDVVTPDANGELPDLEDISESAGFLLPVEAPTLALPTAIIPAIPTNPFDIPVPEGFEDIDFPEPTAVASIIRPEPSVDEFADIPADILNIPWPDLDENGFPIDVPVAPTAGLAAPLALPTDINWDDFPVPDEWVDDDELPATEAPTVALPPAPPALPTDLNFLDIPVPDDFEELVDPLPTAVLPPAVEEPVIPEDILNIPVPEIGEDGLPIEELAPALPDESFGAGFPIQAFPDVPLVLPPAEDLLPVEGVAALTEALSAVPTDAISGLPTSIVGDAVDAVPTLAAAVPEVPAVAAPALPALVPRLPFQVPGGARPVEKRQLQLANLLQPRPIVTRPLPPKIPGVTIVKPIFELISSLLAKLGVDAAQVPNLAAALSLAPTLPPVLPLPGVPTVSEIAEIVENVASVVDSVTSALPLPALASILPLPLPLGLPTIPDIGDILEAAVTDLPVVQPTRAVAAVLPIVPTPATAVGGSRRARRAVQEMQQGPANDWESFLGELDESYQSELAGLIHDSAQAVNEDALDDSFAATLEADIENLSDSTKAQLVKGFATTFGKRDMRHGKRQASPPGALSIGPNLDDAAKVDLSSVLGQAGSLDPFGQAVPSRFFPGSPVDGARPDGIRPRPVDTFNSLPDSSVTGSTRDPELAAILAAGGLDPNGMRSQLPDDDNDAALSQHLEDPYADIRGPWDDALDTHQPTPGLEGLRETLQASKENHIGSRLPLRSAVAQPSSALSASQDAEQRNVLLWFNRYVKPSWNKDVDAEIEIA